MGTYKVPQDVEAEDKLLGPFSFRQFAYLMIVGVAIAVAWGLWTIFIPLAIIPLPVIVFFGALALPLRKDQPMETYLAAVVKFFVVPKKRIWDADGVESLIEITAPKQVEEPLIKNISETEASAKLGYLATLVDTGGWSTRATNPVINSDVYAEASTATDVMDVYDPLAQSIDSLMNKKTKEARQELIEQFKTGQFKETAEEVPPVAPTPVLAPSTEITAPAYVVPPTTPEPAYSQPVVAPMAAPTPIVVPSTSQIQPSPDIIKLANESSDLTVDTVAKQAERIQSEKEHEGEVYISLR